MSKNLTTYNSNAAMPLPATPSLPAEAEATLRTYARASRSESTRRNYAAQWKIFAAWCEGAGHASAPAHPKVVAAWLSDRAQAGIAVSTLNVALAAVANVHTAKGLGFDRNHPDLKMVWEGIRRSHVKPARQAAPVTADLLRDIFASMGDTMIETRDAALLALMYVAALRRSEAAGLDWGKLGDGAGFVTITDTALSLTLAKSKASQGEAVTVSVPRPSNLRTIVAIEAWVAAAGIEPGQPLMRSVAQNGTVGGRISPDGVHRALKCRMARYFEAQGNSREMSRAEAALYSGHSARVGFYVAAADAGAPLQNIAAIARHKTLTMAKRYADKADMLRNAPHKIPGVGL
jgi:site-specific recombinase XerC